VSEQKYLHNILKMLVVVLRYSTRYFYLLEIFCYNGQRNRKSMLEIMNEIQEFTAVPRNEENPQTKERKDTCDNFCSCTTMLLVIISSVCRAALFLM